MPTAKAQRNPAGESPQPETAEPWRAANPGAVRCVDYQAHRHEHRRFEGRWRCFVCHPIGGRCNVDCLRQYMDLVAVKWRAEAEAARAEL